MLFIYYLFRYKTGAFHKIRSSIGSGDVLIIPLFIFSFSPFNFIVFYMISLILSLIFSLTINFFRKNTTIPLAGIQAIVLAACHIFHITGFINMQNDIYTLL
ncbi:MAG: hypothetical protein A2W90_21410 [Bacteroidetes bacterium GWF2_42_66]|nr:MAG: hypothetical protein A2W92_06465 [Bacteroidetes bacterium GWA2_42_15]OFX98892.1 MAG: hypothetical protein A2W89_13045 [Bacteroidetes bacterium GWE2_42_39]OFY45607.1 MAG: hypothetical protein A2W90_21410 [Bacteroidetes bacterium GWF2_42_66]HBL77413.1 hypothetical protein [Prolixibacteraceae bacterium]HCU62423.1 hypothetical protein [Prolixibacteraceae bacterium]